MKIQKYKCRLSMPVLVSLFLFIPNASARHDQGPNARLISKPSLCETAAIQFATEQANTDYLGIGHFEASAVRMNSYNAHYSVTLQNEVIGGSVTYDVKVKKMIGGFCIGRFAKEVPSSESKGNRVLLCSGTSKPDGKQYVLRSTYDSREVFSEMELLLKDKNGNLKPVSSDEQVVGSEIRHDSTLGAHRVYRLPLDEKYEYEILLPQDLPQRQNGRKRMVSYMRDRSLKPLSFTRFLCRWRVESK